MDRIIVTTPTELESIIEKVFDRKIVSEEKVEKTYSINQVAKLLGRSHKKVSDLVALGVLKTTPDNRIFESSIRAYNNK
ncbi:hypothetical protein D0T84_21730 [Dysgonomonas sp. 521]|uniref:hypothetical protein n=1 Tax=Dysgonomonas sp. 521 TaxID=2302932 RepID=UPI0013D63502|nr:hypothetical protein [Dysgonomonas sp. 521]NDV97491.1 hypothetical protein [Dysgonomonas sp. 521]